MAWFYWGRKPIWPGGAGQGMAWQGMARQGFIFNKQGKKMTKVKANIEIEGCKPFLWHTFPLDALSTTKKREGTTGDNKSEWTETVLMDNDRRLYIYNSYLLSSIADGGKEIKQGRGNISKKVSSTLDIEEYRLFLTDLTVPSEDDLTRNDTDIVYLDVRAVVNPMTKGRNLRYRIAARPGWKLKFIVGWDDRILSKDQIKSCIENAGDLQGIGDGRGLGFGRFKLLKFEMIKN